MDAEWIIKSDDVSQETQDQANCLVEWVSKNAHPDQPAFGFVVQVSRSNAHPRGESFLVEIQCPLREVWLGQRPASWHGKPVQWLLKDTTDPSVPHWVLGLQ